MTSRHTLAQRTELDALVQLFEVDLTMLGGPLLYWTPGPLANGTRNLVQNPCCAVDTATWAPGGVGSTIGRADALGQQYSCRGFGSGYFRRTAGLASGEAMAAYAVTQLTGMAGNPRLREGSWVEAQVRVVPMRCRVYIQILFRDASGAQIGNPLGPYVENTGAPSQANQPDQYQRLVQQAQVPAGACEANLVMVATGPGGGAAGDPCVLFTMAQVIPVSQPSAYPAPYMPTSLIGTVQFGGVPYTPIPVMVEGMRLSSQGSLPRPRATLPNVGNYASALLSAYRGLLRAKVSRKRVFARHLDTGPEPDPSEYFGPDVWYVDRLASLTADQVVLELASPLDIQGKKIPVRQCIKDVCTHTYRVWNPTTSSFIQGSCPYTGPNYFTADATPTGDPALDDCGRRPFTDCTARYPYPDTLPTKAFPGLIKGRL